MANDSVLIPVNADTDKLEKQIKDAVSEINKQLKSISFFTLVSGFASAIDLAGKFANTVSSAFAAPIKEAALADEAIDKLNISLKLSGSFSEQASKQFLDFASSLQETTAFSDEAAAGSLTLAKNLGLSNDQALKVTKTAADLAAITGGSLQDATEALSKSLQGNGTQLQRNLPFLRGLTEQQLRAGAAVDILAQKFNGAAAALSQTFSGSIARTANVFSDLLETIGRFITQNPIVIGLISELGQVFDDLNAFIIANQKTIREFVDTALLGVIDGFIGISQAVGLAIQTIAPLASTIVTFIAVSAGIRIIPPLIAAISAAFKGVSISALGAQAAVSAFKITLTFGLSFIIDQLIQIALASKNIEDFFRRLAASVKGLLIGAIDAALFLFEKFIDLGSKIPQIGGQFAKVGDSVRGLRVELQKSQVTTEENTNALNKGVASAGESVNKLTERLQKFGDSARANFGKAAKAASESISSNIEIVPQINASQFKSAFDAGFKDVALATGITLNLKQLDISAEQATLLGAGASVLSNLFKGAQGATAALSGVVGSIANTLIPGLGGVASQIFEVFAAGPEAVRGFVSGFINSIPLIISSVLESLPVFIDALVTGILELPQKLADSLSESLPEVIGRLAGQLPFIAQRLAISLQAQAPFIARSFAVSFIKDGIPAIVKGFVEEIKNQLKSLGGILGGGGGIGGALGKVTKIFGFAEGGTPRFSGGDNLLAGFNANELVVDKTTTEDLAAFLKNQKSQNTQAARPAVINVTVPVQVDRNVLAQTIFQLNQDGFRTA